MLIYTLKGEVFKQPTVTRPFFGEQMNKIKAVFFDLDDTLYDCSGSLVKEARKRAAVAMVKHGLPTTVGQTLHLLEDIESNLGPRISALELVTNFFLLPRSKADKIQKAGLKAYNQPIIGKIALFPGVKSLLLHLKRQGIRTAVITSGNIPRQKRKIQKLGLSRLVDHIEYHDVEKESSKQTQFEKVLKKLGVVSSEVMVVGDRVHSEIRVGNALGMITVRLMHGRYSQLKPATKLEVPDFEIQSMVRLPEILSLIDKRYLNNASISPSIVLIGGGSGMANLLLGLKNYTKNITAIITVTDTGRSSGRIRKDFDVVAPGDIRNCLVALSNHEELLKNLFQYRFENGELKGHSFGNLFLATLYKLTGNFEKAVFEAGRILAITGKVLPATITNAHICARLADGTELHGEDTITGREEPVYKRSPIVEVFLEPQNAKASLEAIHAISNADLIVIGPGQLYNSVVSNLLVPDIRRAIQKSNAKKIYICNIMTQQGQTDKYTASDHIRQIQRYIGPTTLDFALVNTEIPPKGHLKEYEKEHAFMVAADKPDIELTGIKPIYEHLLQKDTKKKLAFNRREYLRHDPDKVGKALLELL